MDTLYERIQKLCKSKGVSGSRMCLDLGLSKSTMSDLKYGRTKGMSTATASKIAAYFDVPVGYLLGEEEKISADPVGMAERHFEMIMDEDISELFEDFRHLDKAKRKMVKDLVRSLAETKKSEA